MQVADAPVAGGGHHLATRLQPIGIAQRILALGIHRRDDLTMGFSGTKHFQQYLLPGAVEQQLGDIVDLAAAAAVDRHDHIALAHIHTCRLQRAAL